MHGSYYAKPFLVCFGGRGERRIGGDLGATLLFLATKERGVKAKRGSVLVLCFYR
jgi:hypothetical protein